LTDFSQFLLYYFFDCLSTLSFEVEIKKDRPQLSFSYVAVLYITFYLV